MNTIVGRILHADSKKKKSPSTSPKISRRRAGDITVLHDTVVLSKVTPRDTVPIQCPIPEPPETTPWCPIQPPETSSDQSGDEEEDIEAAGARYLRQMSGVRRPTVTEIVTGNESHDDDTDMEGGASEAEEGPWTELQTTRSAEPPEVNDQFDTLKQCWAVAFPDQTVPDFADLTRQEIDQYLGERRKSTEDLKLRLENAEYCVKYLEYMQYVKSSRGGGVRGEVEAADSVPGSDPVLTRSELRENYSDEEFYSVDDLDRETIRASLNGESTSESVGTPDQQTEGTPVDTPVEEEQSPMQSERDLSVSESLSPIERDPFGENKFSETSVRDSMISLESQNVGDICDLDEIDLDMDDNNDKDMNDGPKNLLTTMTTNDRVSIRIKRTYDIRSQGDRKSMISVDSISSDIPEDEVFESRRKDAVGPDNAINTSGNEDDHHYRMRKLVMEGVLDTESVYLSCLVVLLKYKKIFEVSGTTSQPVLCAEDCALIFYKVRELHNIHNDFHKGLQPKVRNYTPQQEVGDSFKLLVSQLPAYEDYLKNYERALQTIDRCRRSNEQFNSVAASVKNGDNHQTLEGLIVRPVERVTRITLVLQDLLKHTPVSHPDHTSLKESLETSQAFLDKINKSAFSAQGDKTDGISSPQRHLVKDAFLVELSDGKRKLRHVFLFPDLLICATQRTTRKIFSRESMRESYECQWYIPLGELMLIAHDVQHIDSSPVPVTSEVDMENHKAKVAELRKEYRKLKASNSDQPAHRKVVKGIEKVKKRLAEQEAALTLAFPSLPFRVFHKNGKTYTFLMSSGDERAEWKEAITKLQEKYPSRPSLTNYEVQALLNSTRVRKVNTVGSLLLNDSDEPALSGSLCVTVQSASGFTEEGRVHCLIEVDSFGHFEHKARTGTCTCTTEASWNEDFDVELEEAQTLRVSCFWEPPRGGTLKPNQHSPPGGRRSPIQKIAGPRNPPCHTRYTTIRICLKLRHISQAATLKRQKSMAIKGQKGMFGVPLGTTTKIERRPVPQIVDLCTQEVEKRGVEELGIYRISAVSSDVQKLKKAFDTGSKDLHHMIQETDINAVAGVLKLYFRELPEPLFTNELYPSFADSLALADPDAKERSMLSLFHELPEVNHATALHMMRHLRRVAEKEEVNKMNINNLSTVFGPTLLRPSEANSPSDMSSAAFVGDVLTQVGVLQYLLMLPVSEDRRQALSSSGSVDTQM
ncbi:PREDICTED: LOW QUALITY PROTEIN: active breakpoint cluster region-related protein-like [Branchiostoma belcheri]|uniref:LOW QUALITY PROTEIN: active breakpoint cluster region-related protein-like n=1 Tax=Branchiostoma belcheri TaxID=7741 RepID=A0A6P4Y7Z2_BRABE|nr:PREDICTED: LOW QUALITY PROTEIN: active breakpoint cluster region-related protein-like [Branchiostoma belcheri]